MSCGAGDSAGCSATWRYATETSSYPRHVHPQGSTAQHTAARDVMAQQALHPVLLPFLPACATQPCRCWKTAIWDVCFCRFKQNSSRFKQVCGNCANVCSLYASQVWQSLFSVRSLVVPMHEDVDAWLKFAGLCRKSGRQRQVG